MSIIKPSSEAHIDDLLQLQSTDVNNPLHIVIYSVIRANSGIIEDFRIDYHSMAVNKTTISDNRHPGNKQPIETLSKSLRSSYFEAFSYLVETGEAISKELFIHADNIGEKQLTRVIEINAVKYGDGILVAWQDMTERLETEKEKARILAQAKLENKQLHQLNKKVIENQEQECKHISQELHDDIGQALTAMSFNLAALQVEISPKKNTLVSERLNDTMTLIEQTLQHTRDLTLRLYPSMLDDLGLIPALRWYTDQFSKNTKIETLLDASDFNSRLPIDIEMSLYRIAVELLTNVAQHSQARQANLTLHHDSQSTHLSIEDNGIGFNASAIGEQDPQPSAIGLFGVKERAAALGGGVVIKSSPGRGTQVIIDIPTGRP